MGKKETIIKYEIKDKFVFYKFLYKNMSKSEITVQSTNYMHNVVYQAKNIITINDKISYFLYKVDSQTKFEHDIRYFKRFEIQYNFKLDKEQAETLLRTTIKKIKKQFQFMKEIKSKYILKYTSLVFCYPYACLYHQPIINHLQNFLKDKKPFCFKLKLMLAIIKGLDDLHGQEIDIYPLNPKLFLSHQTNIKNPRQHSPKLSFSKIKNKSISLLMLTKKINVHSILNLDENRYLPPQTINHQIYLRKSHSWCLGAIMYFIWFEIDYDQEKFQQEFKKSTNESKPNWIINLISNLVVEDPEERWKIKDIYTILKNAKLCGKVIQNQL